MSDLKISVITPSYNQGEYIEETIQSVIRQNYSNIEYFIIDGGSTDNTIEIIKRYESHIDFWVSEADEGQSHAINKGLQRSTGDIVAWLNSDDQYFSADTLKQVAEFFNKHKSVDACYGNNVYVDANGEVLYLRMAPRFFSIKLLKKWNYIHQPTVFLRRDVVSNFHINNELDYIMDYEYWLRVSSRYKFRYLNAIISASRWHRNCKTIGNIDKFFAELQMVHRELDGENRNHLIPPLLVFKVFYNIQRILSTLFLYQLIGGKRFPGIKVLEWKKILKRQMLGLRFGS